MSNYRNFVMSIIFVIPFFLLSQLVEAQVNRKICISIDDLPVVSYGIDNKEEVTKGILSALKKHKVQAIGYVNAKKLFTDAEVDHTEVGYLKQWLEEGMDIGNHTYSHKNYHKVPFDEFAKDILDGEKVVKELVEEYDQKYEFFRHPYLRSGVDAEQTEKLKDFLKKHNYKEAFVTVDDDDYLFALAYARAFKKEDNALMDKIGEAYLQYMVEKLMHFEKFSLVLFSRNINHTLLIHANYLNAQYLDRLLKLYEDLGYEFISQEEAVSDPAYETPVTKFGDWGISWIDKWALSTGKGKELFKNDP
ncbi:MAG: polysaccharide deacetylase family protein, partial [Bacteroidota bacterium]